MLQFLEENGIASAEQLAPYLEQASAASSVRWRALRVRMGRLLSTAQKSEDENRPKEVSERRSAKEAGSGAQVADAKKPKPDREPGKASGFAKRAEAGDQDAGAVRQESDRDSGRARPREQSAQKQDTGLPSSEGAGQPRADHSPDAARKRPRPRIRRLSTKCSLLSPRSTL